MSLSLTLFAPSVPFLPDQVITVEAASKIKLNKKEATLYKGESITLKLKGTKKKAKWTSSKKAVATVNSKGKVTAKAAGTTTITAKIGKKKYRCKITVQTPHISQKNITLTSGESTTLKIYGVKQKVKWKSSNNKIVSINSKGKVTAKTAGTTTITATVSKKKYTCKVTVKNKTESTQTQYPAGMYKVGQNIPVGQYLLVADDYYAAYFELSSDSSGSFDSIICNDIFNSHTIVSVNCAEYLKLSDCHAIPIQKAKLPTNTSDGMFRVGIDIPAGEYVLTCIDSLDAYYEISSDDRHSINSIITNGNFGNTVIITVQNGQYLRIDRCQMTLL